MEKQIVKIYSETGKVPEYKTSDASGFDLFSTFTNNSCQILTINDIEEIDAFYVTGNRKDAAEFITEIIPSLEKNAALLIMNPQSYIISIKLAIEDKLEEINKNIEKNGGKTYGVLSDYMSDNDIEAVNIILPFSHNIIPTGCYVQIPEGYEIQVRPRSGIGAKTNMIAHLGTIDNDYRGNIGIIINNPSPNSYIILPNERLAQGVFAKVEQCEFKKVKSIEELTKTDRGEGGFGSTGK
ncbi:MAG: dUTP diphosphatase [Lachnospiraceae bacterium]